MTELERYRKALILSREPARTMVKEMYQDTRETCLLQVDGAINAILNPPPVVETIEVVRWTWGGGHTTWQSQEEAERDAPAGVAVYKLTGTLTREVQKVERSDIANPVYTTHNGVLSATILIPEKAIGKPTVITVTWEE